MKRKTLFGSIAVLIVSLLTLMVYASGGIGEIIGLGTIQPILVGSPTAGDNISGSYNFTVIIEQVNSTGISNVTISFNASNASNGANPTGRNALSLYNITLINNSVNQSRFNTTFDTTLVPDGRYNLTVVATNNTGGYNDTILTELTVDNTKPNATKNVTNANYDINNHTMALNTTSTYYTNRTFNITAADSMTGVQNITLSFNNGSIGPAFNFSVNNSGGAASSNNANNNWYFSYNLSTLRAGEHTVTVIANDWAGNTNRSEVITFTINSPPNVSWNTIGGANYSLTTSNITFNFSVTNNTINGIGGGIGDVNGNNNLDMVMLMFNNGSGQDFNVTNVTLGPSPNNAIYWGASYNVSRLAEGSHTVTAFVNDTIANYNNTQSITFFVDYTKPVVTVT